MKRIIYTLIIVAALYSCKKDDDDCECTARFTTQSNLEGYGFINPKTKIDCITGQPVELPQSDAVFLECID